MIKTIKINYEVIELMDFYWQTAARREKLTDSYLLDIAKRPEMQTIYHDDFNENSVRKVLSAVINYEPVNEATKKEMEFYNFNKFFADDPGNVDLTLPSIKTLNINEFLKELPEEIRYDEIQINFIPAYDIIDKIEGNTLTVNFFKLGVDFTDFETVLINNQPLKDYLRGKILEML